MMQMYTTRGVYGTAQTTIAIKGEYILELILLCNIYNY